MTLDTDPQVDYRGKELLEWLRAIRRDRKTQKYVLELHATDGELATLDIYETRRSKLPTAIRGRKNS